VSGTIVAADTPALTFSVSGKVATAAVKQGDRVKTGQVLATLDTKRFDLSVIVKEVQPAFGPAIHPLV
jgi:multidrug efflux pump subunit AcrA (membrane-fusion protein)